MFTAGYTVKTKILTISRENKFCQLERKMRITALKSSNLGLRYTISKGSEWSDKGYEPSKSVQSI